MQFLTIKNESCNLHAKQMHNCMFNFFKNIFGPNVDFKALMNDGAIIIDVRSPQEFDLGHIKGSKNIPLTIIQRETQLIKKWDKPIIVVCQSGGRSSMAKSSLKAAGINVFNGGGWEKLNKKLH